MTLCKTLPGLICLLAACTSHSQPSDDNRQHVQLLWRNPRLNWVTSSLLLKDSLLYFGSYDHTFGAATLADGKRTLTFQTGDDPYYPPVLSQNRIYFSSFDLYVYCLNSSGQLAWKRKTADRVKNALLERDGVLYVSVRSDGLWALSTQTGAAVWHVPQPAVSLSTNQPVLRENTLYVGMWGLADSLLAVDRRTGKVGWATSYPGYASSDPAASPHGLLVCNDKYYQGGKVKLLAYANGAERWSTDLNCESLYQPSVQDNRAVVATYDGQVVCLNMLTGQTLWASRLQPHEQVSTQFRRLKRGIYFGTTARNLYCLDSATGKPVFTEPFNYGIADPQVANGKLYIPTGGNEMWSLKD